MKKPWLIAIVIILALALGLFIFRGKFLNRGGPAALQVSSTPSATVFLDGESMGITPFFNDQLEPGEHTVKMVPEATTDQLVSWEGKVSLAPNILTVINRTFGSTEAESSGEILALEKISKKDKASLEVISIPDQAVIKIDGEPKGFAPVLTEDLSAGDYQVTVSAPGYQEKIVSAHTVAGYKLTVTVQLAQEKEEEEEATPSAEKEESEEPEKEKADAEAKAKEEEAEATPTPKSEATTTPSVEEPYVRINETPTGWLRVREESSTESTELAKVNPGETYPYLGETESGWHKIEYQEGEEGWVSGVYSELVE
ncbi:MAG TPA: PEGA domain-containing protein [Candidatus Bathyarchaeia archaeon]|nr:PEGA domain-containing protein [Candidatus Bathyarchaeia archaeon]